MRRRWEYLSLRGGLDRQGLFYVVYALNGRAVREQPSFYEYVARLGRGGWELVGSDAGTLWFERPLEEEEPPIAGTTAALPPAGVGPEGRP